MNVIFFYQGNCKVFEDVRNVVFNLEFIVKISTADVRGICDNDDDFCLIIIIMIIIYFNNQIIS